MKASFHFKITKDVERDYMPLFGLYVDNFGVTISRAEWKRKVRFRGGEVPSSSIDRKPTWSLKKVNIPGPWKSMLYVISTPSARYVFSRPRRRFLPTDYQALLLHDQRLLDLLDRRAMLPNPPAMNPMSPALQWAMWALYTAGMFLA